MFNQPLNKLLTSFTAWIFGKLSPLIVGVDANMMNVPEVVRENITFWLQSFSFLVASIAGILAIYGYINKSKDKK
jgi:hypothetical protein